MPPTLATARLWLRRPEPADAAALFAFTADPEVTRLLDWQTHIDLADSRDFLTAADEGWDAGDDYCWVLGHSADTRVIGTVGCRFDEHGAEIGYLLARACWGRGLATEAARAIFAAARAIDDVHRIWATCDVDNLASARVLEKIGLVREARLARWSARPNLGDGRVPGDVFVYAWTR